MTVGDRLFRALVRLLPEDVRAGYARDMEATFRAERRAAAGGARWPRLTRLWVATIGDLVRTAPVEHADVLARDLRLAIRALAARPLLTLTAIFTLAIGVGANVAMFAVVDTVLLAPLPYRDPAALVMIQETAEGTQQSTLGYLTFTDLRARSRSIETMAAVGGSIATITGDGLDAERVNAMRVSHTYFDLLGAGPMVGRTFTEAEDAPGPARRVVVLSEALWRRRFRADPSVVGRPIVIGEIPYTVVGVMPAAFADLVSARLYLGAEVWYPLGYDPAADFACRSCRHLRAIGRLAPGRTAAEAEREIAGIVGDLQQEHPRDYHAAGARVIPMADFFLGPVRSVLLVLWAGVGLLLLVAGSNVANLLLLGAGERSHEIAVRAALGVTRGRLTRQFLTESVLLAMIGGLAGLAPAWAVVRLLALQGPAEIPRLTASALDGRAVAVALAVSLVAGLVFGLIPIAQWGWRDVTGSLHGAGRRTASVVQWRLRALLVAGNVAMAALLLVGSGLLVRSLVRLLAVEPGFETARALTLQVALSGSRYRPSNEPEKEIAAAVRFYDEVRSRVQALPGVESAAAVTALPMGPNRDQYGLHVAGRPWPNPEEAPSPHRFVVTPGLLQTLGVPLIHGRLLDERDRQGAEAVVVINRALAEEIFRGEDPLGHRVSLGPPDAPQHTIVGVVGDVKHEGLDRAPGLQVWVPQAQWAWAETTLTFVVRARGDAATLAAPIRDIVRQVDPAQPVTDVKLYDDVVRATTGTRRFAAWLLGAFAATAVAMAVVGLSGALGVMVGQRRREIGVRVALGARAGEIRRMVLGQGLRPVVAGLAVGLLGAAFSARLLTSLLYDLAALDAATFATVAITLLVAAVAACLLPAWRASRVDPVLALRSE
jgi:putative ABC transport system permease protein